MVKVIAEIGINHNGSIEECKKMIMLAKIAGCDYAKIQKRNPDICVPEHQKTKRKIQKRRTKKSTAFKKDPYGYNPDSPLTQHYLTTGAILPEKKKTR